MERRRLQDFLAEGLSLAQIGECVGKDPSTIGYWCKRHGLTPVHSERFRPKGGVARETLAPLMEAGLSKRQIAERLGISVSTLRYWLGKHELASCGARKARVASVAEARAKGLDVATLECGVHGHTAFKLYDYGRSRCLLCRSEAVSRRRRRVKRILVDEAGGRCRLCGYDRCPEALEFHHVDPSQKAFALSAAGVPRAIAKAREEAEKCVLVCANCHAEVEAGVSVLPIPGPAVR